MGDNNQENLQNNVQPEETVVEPVEEVEVETEEPVIYDGKPLDINDFEDPEPIEYEEDDLF